MISIKVHGQTMAMVYLFCYLVRTLLVVENDCLAVVVNLHKARKVWDRLLWIMGGMESNKRFYAAVV